MALVVLGVVHLVFTAAVWRAKSHSRVNRLFALHTLPVAGWTFGIALLHDGVWLRTGNALTFASASLIPAGVLTFTSHYPNPRAHATWERAVLIVGLLFAGLSLTDLMVYDVRMGPHGPSRKAGVLYPAFAVYFVAVYAAALVLFARKWKRARGRERIQLNYYGVGLFVVSIFGTTANLLLPAVTGRSTFTHWGPWFAIPLIVLTAHAIVRHRFLDLRIVIHRGVTASAAAVVSLLPFTLLLLLISGPALGRLTIFEAILICVAAVATMALVPRMRQVTERLLDHYVYRSTTNPNRVLRETSAALTHAPDSARVVAVISEAIRAAVNPEGVTTFLESHSGFKAGERGFIVSESNFRSPSYPPEAVVAEARSRQRPILCDELEASSYRVLHRELTAAGWAVVLPLLGGSRMVGIVAVGAKRSGEPFYTQDIDALTTLANHAGSAIHNAILHAEVLLANRYVGNIVDAMQSGVVAVDRLTNISLLNPAARHLLGVPRDTSPVADDLPAPLAKMLKEVSESGVEHVTREIEVANRESPLSLLCTTSLLRDHEGSPVGAVAVFSDLTPLKELDRHRARAEKLAALQELTHALAHEIGNPLVPIKTMTKLLPTRMHDPEFVQNVARIVPRELDRIERLVARLRRVAPKEELVHTRTDVRTPMRHAIEVLEATAAAQDTRLHVSLPPMPVLVSGDSAELEELFLNLLTNALEALADGPLPNRAVDVTVEADDSTATICVCDTGPGIAPELVDKIFDLFVTSKPRGSGLGLSICARIAERHGGRIAVANQPSGGAAVTVILPLLTA
jgi:signal transduction histidine kinase